MEVENFIRNLKVFFLRSEKNFTKLLGIFPLPLGKKTFKYRIREHWSMRREEGGGGGGDGGGGGGFGGGGGEVNQL